MHFFTKEDLTNVEQFELTGDNAHHLLHVLRVKEGEEIELSDACGRRYRSVFVGAKENRACLRIEGEIAIKRELPSPVTLYPCILKGDRMDLIVQKAVELGASTIVPVISARTVARPDAKAARHKTQRWQKIAESAAKQCGRDRIPRIAEPVSFEEAAREAARFDHFIFPYECADGMAKTREIFSSIRPGESVALMIGPEGGYDPREVETAEKLGARIVTLGNRILRAETAALTSLAWLLYQTEEA